MIAFLAVGFVLLALLIVDSEYPHLRHALTRHRYRQCWEAFDRVEGALALSVRAKARVPADPMFTPGEIVEECRALLAAQPWACPVPSPGESRAGQAQTQTWVGAPVPDAAAPTHIQRMRVDLGQAWREGDPCGH